MTLVERIDEPIVRCQCDGHSLPCRFIGSSYQHECILGECNCE